MYIYYSVPLLLASRLLSPAAGEVESITYCGTPPIKVRTGHRQLREGRLRLGAGSRRQEGRRQPEVLRVWFGQLRLRGADRDIHELYRKRYQSRQRADEPEPHRRRVRQQLDEVEGGYVLEGR